VLVKTYNQVSHKGAL